MSLVESRTAAIRRNGRGCAQEPAQGPARRQRECAVRHPGPFVKYATFRTPLQFPMTLRDSQMSRGRVMQVSSALQGRQG
jgi:hypothetical protein